MLAVSMADTERLPRWVRGQQNAAAYIAPRWWLGDYPTQRIFKRLLRRRGRGQPVARSRSACRRSAWLDTILIFIVKFRIQVIAVIGKFFDFAQVIKVIARLTV